MRTLRWTWPMAVLALLALVPWGCYVLRPARTLDVAVLDKTVPFRNRIEHRSLYWILEHRKIEQPGGGGYDRDLDYLGAFPGPVPGDPPERTVDLTETRALAADLVYLADTYGVYRDDLESGEEMKAALERSPKIYGGLEVVEARAAVSALDAGGTLVAEFNTLGSPTGREASEILGEAVGVRWTRWIGRYFSRLDDESEVPRWMRRNYEREWRRPWTFTGPGFVLLRDDAECEVLRVGREVERIGLTIERTRPIDGLLAEARDGVPYPFWFDVVEARPGASILARFAWHVTASGGERLRARGLPETFPAIVRRSPPGGGVAYYFAGDFADNPMPDDPMPFAGYPAFRRWVEGSKLAPSETAFYWRFYVPMMTRLLAEAGERRPS